MAGDDGETGRLGTYDRPVKSRMLLTRVSYDPELWCPTCELHTAPPGYESGAPLSELDGHAWGRT